VIGKKPILYKGWRLFVASAETYNIIRDHPEHNIWGDIIGL
jgi:hypothetical protein